MSAAELLQDRTIHKRVALKIVYRDELPHYEGSVPGVSDFDPRFIAWQLEAIKLVRTWDYKTMGKLELLLSGALGSAKSIILAHLAITHCLSFEKARVCLGRRAMPDLKETIYALILEHLRNDPQLEEGKDWKAVPTKGYIRFANGSEVVSRAWGDRKGGKKARSLNISMLIVEELTENDEKDSEAVKELVQRVGRLKHVPESAFIAATNPDEPSHWVFKYFMESKSPNRKVIYSITTDNVFLDPLYRETLARDLDPRMVLRMIQGRWISLATDGVYYQYDPARHEPEQEYRVDPGLPIVMSWDFNIGVGKPMSACFSQFKDGVKHFFAEIVIEGARTQNVLEEAWGRGLFDQNTVYYIRGDASGVHQDTRNNLNDYMIIDEWLRRQVRKDGSRIMHVRQVPVENPRVRTRHNVFNAWLLNDLGQVRIQIYPKCKVLRDGMKMVRLKPGASYVEDDTKHYQHVTTAAGYDVLYENALGTKSQTTVRIR